MGAITIADEISGKPVIIENPLLPEHVRLNQLLWYYGYTSMGGWDCPAVIVKVNRKKQLFRVRSLDDMRDQDQWYSFDAGKDSSSSRETMRLATQKEVKAYLEARKKRIEDKVDAARRALSETQDLLEKFNTGVASLRL